MMSSLIFLAVMQTVALRGCLHLSVSVLLALSLVLVSASIVSGRLRFGWWRMLLHLAGKQLSYTCSAVYHKYGTTFLLKMDLATISVAIWAPSSSFAVRIAEWLAVFSVMVLATLANCVAIERQLSGAKHIFRSVLLVLYFALTVMHIGWHYGYGGLWINAVSVGVLAILVSPPLHHHYPRAFWHIKDVNGWHEDFHVLLLVADLIFFRMAIEHLWTVERTEYNCIKMSENTKKMIED